MAALLVDFPPQAQDLVPPPPRWHRHHPAFSAQIQLPDENSRRRVSFASQITVKFVDNLSISHRHDLWFTATERKRFKEEAILMVRELLMVKRDNTELLFQHNTIDKWIGLERHLSSRNVLVQRQRLNKAIRFEQERQLRTGVCDPDILANISEMESDKSRKRARISGLLHADDTQNASI